MVGDEPHFIKVKKEDTEEKEITGASSDESVKEHPLMIRCRIRYDEKADAAQGMAIAAANIAHDMEEITRTLEKCSPGHPDTLEARKNADLTSIRLRTAIVIARTSADYAEWTSERKAAANEDILAILHKTFRHSLQHVTQSAGSSQQENPTKIVLPTFHNHNYPKPPPAKPPRRPGVTLVNDESSVVNDESILENAENGSDSDGWGAWGDGSKTEEQILHSHIQSISL